MRVPKPSIPLYSSQRQRWKNICDLLADDILRDEQEPAIPDEAVSRMRERLARLKNAKPSLPWESVKLSRQQWKNICDLVSEDVLRDEHDPAIPDEAVSRMRERLGRLATAAMQESEPLPVIRTPRGKEISLPLELKDSFDDYCPKCRRITIVSVIRLRDYEPPTMRCSRCSTVYDFRQPELANSETTATEKKPDDERAPETSQSENELHLKKVPRP